MPNAVRGIRGATSLDVDEREHLHERVKALVTEVLDCNGLDRDDVIAVFCTASPDIHSGFPAEAVRACGLADTPLLGAAELEVEGSLARCIRLLFLVNTPAAKAELQHVYLEGAASLRPDLARG